MYEDIDAYLQDINPATKIFEISESILLPAKLFAITVTSGIANINFEEDFEID